MLDNHYAAVSGVSAGISVSYAYDKDRLVKITHNGFEYAFAYDAIGNVLNDGIHDYTWKNGRELATITKTGMTASYTYDAGGIRTSKTVNGVTTEYLTANGSVLSEKKGSEWQHYLYHADGMLSAIRYKGADYYYVRDGLTNIVGLVDSDGNRVVSCEYDSWGKILGITGSMAGTLGQDNPYRYEGYYYDVETGFYYIESRYYDPEICRFISQDKLELLLASPNALTDKNLYAYCDNNPLIRADRGGEFWLTCVVGGLATQYASDVVLNLIEGKTGVDVFKPKSSIGEYVAAGVTSLIPVKGIGGSLLCNMVSEGIANVEKMMTGKKINITDSFINVFAGTVIDKGFEIGVSKIAKKIESKAPKNYSSYAHEVRKKEPTITRQEIYKKINSSAHKRTKVIKVITKISDVGRACLPY